MKRKLLLCSLLSISLFGAKELNAQDVPDTNVKPKFNSWSVSAGIGSMLFYGDARVYDGLYPASNDYVNERRMGFGLTVNKQLSDKFAVHGNLIYGKLAGAKLGYQDGKKAYTGEGSSAFEANVFEYTILGSFNLTGVLFKEVKKFSVNPYLGIGLVNFRSKRHLLSNPDNFVESYGYKNALTDEKDQKTSEIVVPVGLLFNYKINKRFDIGLDFSMRNVNTDKLDALNTIGTAKDKYGYTAINFTYKLGAGEKDLKWLEPEDKAIVEGLPDMKKYDDKLTEVDKKLEELNAKNAELDKKLEDLNSKTDELNKKAEELNKKAEEKAKETGSSGAATKSGTSSTGKETNVTDFFAIEFEPNSAILKKDSYKDLKLLAEVLTQNPKCELKVDGHTDVTGSPALNFKLSQQRANAVKDYLIKTGVPNAVRIKTEAWGEKKPVAANDTEEGKAKNRRVELTVRCDEK